MTGSAAAYGPARGPHIAGSHFCRQEARHGHFPFIAAVAVVAVLVLALTLRIATQYQRAVIFRLGRYNRTGGPGVYFLWPFIEWQTTLDLRTKNHHCRAAGNHHARQRAIKINAVIWQRVVDPMRAVLEVADVGNAVIQVAVTTLRSVIGQHTLDDVLKEQDAIARVIEATLTR